MAFLRNVCSQSYKPANEYVEMANEGKMSVLSMMQDIEENTDVRFDEMNKNLVKKMGV